MPKSKRATVGIVSLCMTICLLLTRMRVVPLTKTDKKGREGKEKLMEEIHECIDNYPYIWVFSVKDMRNTFLKEVRNEFKATSRFFMGKNRVMAKAFGNTPEEEYKLGLSKIAEKLNHEVGLLFTSKSPEEVQEYFKEYKQPDYARSGVVATQTVIIPEGPVMRGVDPMPHNMEALIRSLGMPTSLKNGIVTLSSPYTICKEGDTLSTNQAHLLKLFYYQLSEFSVELICCYHNGEVTEV
ncbi:mRNA turnover and ribosome assembly protein [Apophysomyces ossiformis]|uniref:Ribosome assembly factor mrt4 n=1 Tax=Apophysomyces ossiformis TaxID=679940 RepID=A0A8H7EQK7_9FUNG|nr:mRNA turnover and ribosome assembly protein [Apophysomyces ossiformis]